MNTQQKSQIASIDDPSVRAVMTPAELSRIHGDSYHVTDAGKMFLRDKTNWFVPIGVLENRMTFDEAVAIRTGLPTIPDASSISTFKVVNNLLEGATKIPDLKSGDVIGIRLPVPAKNSQAFMREVIIEKPRVVIDREDGTSSDITEVYFLYLERMSQGKDIDPYAEGFLSIELPRVQGEGSRGSKERAA